MKRGFTLAEVLLALTIIGVIAALTLPGLKSNIGTRKANAWYQKYCNIIDGAASQAMLENNVANATDLSLANIQGQLQGHTVGGNFTMKDGSVISAGAAEHSIRVTFPTDVHVDDRVYVLDNDFEGIDCTTNGQAVAQ